MPRNRQRTSAQGSYGVETLNLVLQKVRDGTSKQKAEMNMFN